LYLCTLFYSGVVLGTDNIPLQTHEIRMMFCRCSSLLKKPKIFFYQSCRGVNYQRSYTVGLQIDGPNGNTAGKVETSQLDCLIGQSTVDGSCSFRHPEKGSLFITALVDALKTIQEISKVQLKVTQVVSSAKFAFSGEAVSQTPEWTNTLTAEVKFK